MTYVIFEGHVKNSDIIDLTFGKTKTPQHSIHDLLKLYKGVLDTRWQKFQLVQNILHMKANPPKCYFEASYRMSLKFKPKA